MTVVLVPQHNIQIKHTLKHGQVVVLVVAFQYQVLPLSSNVTLSSSVYKQLEECMVKYVWISCVHDSMNPVGMNKIKLAKMQFTDVDFAV